MSSNVSDQDGWVGEFSGGMEYALLWKEGEVFLLPLTEEDIGFYKAPGESGEKIIRDLRDYSPQAGSNGCGDPQDP